MRSVEEQYPADGSSKPGFLAKISQGIKERRKRAAETAETRRRNELSTQLYEALEKHVPEDVNLALIPYNSFPYDSRVNAHDDPGWRLNGMTVIQPQPAEDGQRSFVLITGRDNLSWHDGRGAYYENVMTVRNGEPVTGKGYSYAIDWHSGWPYWQRDDEPQPSAPEALENLLHQITENGELITDPAVIQECTGVMLEIRRRAYHDIIGKGAVDTGGTWRNVL